MFSKLGHTFVKYRHYTLFFKCNACGLIIEEDEGGNMFMRHGEPFIGYYKSELVITCEEQIIKNIIE